LHPAPTTAQPVAQVRDPAVRALMLDRRRAPLAEVASIARHCGIEPDAPDDEVA